MDFAFSADQEDLRTVVRDFLADRSPEAEVRRVMETAEGFDPVVWEQLGSQLGVVGLVVPEEYGGAGGSLADAGVVLEEAGRALLCAPYLSSAVLAPYALLYSGDDEAKADYLPDLASGKLRGTLALAEDAGRWDAGGIRLRATRSAGGWTLDGHKSFVLDGTRADLVLVAARADDDTERVSLFAVEAGTARLDVVELSTLDPTRRQARLEFAGVAARLVGAEGGAWPALTRVLDVAAIALAAEQVGGAARVLEMAVEHARTRHQFGRPIGSFQAIKHKCADMLVEVECARSAAYHGLWSAAEQSDELPMAASVAKARCSDAFVRCALENIQVHGGIGFTWEHPAHLYLRRAKSSQLLFGSSAQHREQLARRIGLR